VGLLLASLRVSVRMVLVDGDDFDPVANTSRMFFSRAGNKALVVRDDLAEYFVDSTVALSAIGEYVTHDNIGRLIHDGDIVLLCVDNHATRKLVSDYCSGKDGFAGLVDICLISGGNDGVGRDSTGQARQGTYGNCQVFARRGGRDISAPLDVYHPEIADPADHSPAEADCVESITSTPQILPANVQAASAMLSTLWLELCGTLHYGELAFDIAQASMRPLPLPMTSKA
jgi:molybdopterin/thiamine biosynthesis adenylyltransferase